METINIHADINVPYITAASFPVGIMAAQQALHTRMLKNYIREKQKRQA